jgi:hypothetical protein
MRCCTLTRNQKNRIQISKMRLFNSSFTQIFNRKPFCSLLYKVRSLPTSWLQLKIYLEEKVQAAYVISKYIFLIKKNWTPWPESASELYRQSNCRLWAKLVQTFADRWCRVVSETNPYGRILGFLYPKYIFTGLSKFKFNKTFEISVLTV